MTTQEGNKLIAEFMGANEATLPFGPDKMQMPTNPFPSGMWTCAVDELEYDKSWDWLMPVVEKVEKLGYHTDIIYYVGEQRCIISEGTPQGDGGKHTNFIADTETDPNPDDKVTTVWLSVIQFILWYNTNNPKTPPHAK